MKLIFKIFILTLFAYYLFSCQQAQQPLLCLNTSCINSHNSLDTFVDPRDGNSYEIVTIGTQTWFAENLRFNTTNSGLNPNNPCSKYGRLYTWGELMNNSPQSSSNPSGVQGICPSGWHIPSNSEWNELEMFLGLPPEDTSLFSTGPNIPTKRGNHANKMKATTGWPNSPGINSSGLNIFPAGRYIPPHTLFSFMCETTEFWTSTSVDTIYNLALTRMLRDDYHGVIIAQERRDYALSCRCVKD